jgi:hypothetical protein
MNLDKLFSVAMAIVVVAGITTVALHPAFAQSITAIGNSFAKAIQAATQS